MSMEKHDAQLWQILQDEHTITGFFNSIFGFLARNTDFYHLSGSQNRTIGFAPGIRENMVLRIMQSFEINKRKIPFSTHLVDDVADDVADSSQINLEDDYSDICAEETVESIPEIMQNLTISSNTHRHKSNTSFQKNEYYNGAQFGHYCWSQTINDIEIFLKLPDSIKNSKQITVEVDTNYVKIVDLATNNILLRGILFEKCKNNDVVWSIQGKKLHLQIDKIKELWWKKFLLSEPNIDLTKIDCSRSIYDLPEESQAIIEKLKYDQQRKYRGKFTSDEEQRRAILRDAWNSENSPFKGQPFDESMLQLFGQDS